MAEKRVLLLLLHTRNVPSDPGGTRQERCLRGRRGARRKNGKCSNHHLISKPSFAGCSPLVERLRRLQMIVMTDIMVQILFPRTCTPSDFEGELGGSENPSPFSDCCHNF